MIGFSVASIGGTAYLWYTYFDIKNNLDKTPKHMLLSESVKNETAFFWYSVIATVITVSKFFLNISIFGSFIEKNCSIIVFTWVMIEHLKI